MIIMLCILIGCSRSTKEQEEFASTTYNQDEKLSSVNIGYVGKTDYDVIVIDFDNETLNYTMDEEELKVKSYKISNTKEIYEYFKQNILYGNWDGKTLKQTHYISKISPQDMGKQKLWSVYVSTFEEESKYRFSDFDSYPTFWNELVELICEGTHVESKEFGILIDEKPEETIANTNSDITSIKIHYGGVPNINTGAIDIDINKNEMIFNTADNISTRYNLRDSQEIVNFFESKVLCDNWDKEMLTPPSEVKIYESGYSPRQLLWYITITKGNEEYIYGDYKKYPYYWYELIDLICEGTGISRRTLDIH